ncbi:hypothetical protein [Nocardiopsis ansamitocini]|uniref:Uncharacterized protein n=1 Tax=Nocardiopsis ansamitocini TaxID=1670832 RepID=A0A9W6UHK5_9ACTN|nr:hypothetical protein [Nocardiopsis ansamitocini]GLU46458.1 hypothetical protein Nans01_08090 [Nocardiopsis ansamitocini]
MFDRFPSTRVAALLATAALAGGIGSVMGFGIPEDAYDLLEDGRDNSVHLLSAAEPHTGRVAV